MDLKTQDAGFIIFGSQIPRDMIAEFMHELQASNYQYHWIDLHMRDAGGRTALSYRVDLRRADEHTHERFHHQITGRLKKLLGEDDKGRPNGVDQWSMANVLESST